MRDLNISEIAEINAVAGGVSSLGTYIGAVVGAICGAVTKSPAAAAACAVGGVAATDAIDSALSAPAGTYPVLPNLGFH